MDNYTSQRIFRFDFSLGRTRYLVQVQSEDKEEALRILESAYPDVQSESLIGICEQEGYEEIDVVVDDHIRLDYINTLTSS